MDRINTPDNSHDEVNHEGKKIRMFKDGDGHSEPDVTATLINSQFLNGIQEELCRFIESQQIQLDPVNFTGLARAIDKRISDILKGRLEVYRITINALREHVRKPDTNPLPGTISENGDVENNKEEPNVD